MIRWGHLAIATVFAFPATAQMENGLLFAYEDCKSISSPIQICDPVRDWAHLELPEDLEGVSFTFNNEIEATIEVMVSPWIGIQVRASRYDNRNYPTLMAEEFAKIDGYPAITYIFPQERDGQSGIVAETRLLLPEISISATTFQPAATYTPEHAMRHAEMLAGITYKWSL